MKILILFILILIPNSLAESSEVTQNKDVGNGVIPPQACWISSAEGFLGGALSDYYCIYGCFPHNMKELLDSGYPPVWPADPITFKPASLVKSIKPVKEDIGKIAYVFESDVRAYFQIVKYDRETNQFVIRSFPSDESIANQKKFFMSNPTMITEFRITNFSHHMNMLYQDTFRNYRDGSPPENIQTALKGKYFWIKENIAPPIVSSNPDIPYFHEWGLCSYNDKWFMFEDGTTWLFSQVMEKGVLRKFVHVNRGGMCDSLVLTSICLRRDSEEFRKSLENKIYYYSTRLLLDGTLEIPEDVVITSEEILRTS